MNKILLDKYASLLLKSLKVEDKKYLFIELPNFLTEFKDSLDKAIKEYELNEVYYDLVDQYKKHELMVYLDQENIYKHPMFDKSYYDRYAKLDAAFLFIRSEIPGLMNDVPADKIKNTMLHQRSTQKYFRDLYEGDKLHWCIACAANPEWASTDLKMTEDELWDLIFKVCLVDEETDAFDNWIAKDLKIKEYTNKLNELNLKSLHYENSLGTNFTIELTERHRWMSGSNDHHVFNNMPTEETFTSPQYDSATGIVYASKPLIYNDSSIEDFWIEFKEGKVVNFDAKVGYDLLKAIIETDEYSCYLGEVALVNFNSPINNTNVIFHETLYDENASCHLALGIGFIECLRLDEEIRSEDLRKYGVNVSKQHVDFMIGTSDLTITGTTNNGEEVKIFKDGNFCI